MSDQQKNIRDLLNELGKSGYRINITVHDKSIFPLSVSDQKDCVIVKHNNKVIFTVTASSEKKGGFNLEFQEG